MYYTLSESARGGNVARESTDFLSPDVIQKLKHDIRTSFGDVFFALLEDVVKVERNKTRNTSFFLDVMSRRLKRISSLHS